MGIENLNYFFKPRAIAVIGASDREDSIGGKIFRNLAGQFDGLIFPINPFRRSVNGTAAFPTVEKLPSKADLAIVATPAHTIPQIMEECGKTGITNIIIVSAGFDKDVADGKDLNKRILELKKTYNLRVLGPNSYGVMRPKDALYATFGDKKAVPGKIAFISQSAALCGLVLDWSNETQVGLSAVVSTGYSIDVDIGDLVDYFGEDPQTRVMMLYFEDLNNIRAFMSAARGFARTKPIVLIKARRLAEGKPDFNNVVGDDELFDAAFRRVGVVRVDTVTELLACGRALSMQPHPEDNSLAIVTNAGGPGAMAVDELRARGGELWKPNAEATDSLRSVVPYYCYVSNPIDVLEEADPERFRRVLQVCAADPSVRNLLLIYTSLGATDPLSMANIIVETIKQKRKTTLAVVMGKDRSCQEARRLLNSHSIPAFETPEEAVSTFMHMYAYTKNLELLYQTPEELELPSDVPTHLRGIIRCASREGRHSLSLSESLLFLDAYRIPVLKSLTARNVEQAKKAAAEIGFPVRLKALCPHSVLKPFKEEFYWDAKSPSDVETAYSNIMDKVRNSILSIESPEMLVQKKPKTENLNLFALSKKDLKFGSIILFGVRDGKSYNRTVSVGFPPLNQVLAKQILSNSDFCKYIRDRPNGQVLSGAVGEILVKLAQLAVDFPEIKEIDVDPLVVGNDGVDAASGCITLERNRVLLETSDHHEHLVISPYPKKYLTLRTLKNGLQVRLRPIKPEDENRFNELFRSLSAESVRFRFFETIREMSHDTLTRYCNLDYDREIAIVAERLDDKRIIGVVRIIPDLAGKTGEFAIMVGDEWQGMGLGSKLMDIMYDVAKDLKLEEIQSYVSRDNTKMIRMCTKKGFNAQTLDEYIVEMSKKLTP